MLKYAKIINEETKECSVGMGIDAAYYASLGMVEMDVEEAYNHKWYVKGYAPAKPEPTLEEQVSALESKYQMTRWQREGILAEGSLYSDYTKAKAQEIENLASELRGKELSGATLE